MGSFCNLYIGEFDFYGSKNFVEPFLMTLFRESDKQIINLDKPIVDGPTIFKYCNTVGNIRQRLDIMGFTIKKSMSEFQKGINQLIENLNISLSYDFLEKSKLNEELQILQTLSYDFWFENLVRILNEDLRFVDNIEVLESNPYLTFMLDSNSDYFWNFGIPFSDFRYVFRCCLDIFEENDEVKLDYSELVSAGWLEEDVNLCELAFSELFENYVPTENIILLTEGSTDISILKNSLKILYPHLSEFYYFMDFENSKAQGSAGSLVSNLKAFIGSGIRNKIVAIFDNDTGASEALKGLANLKIPENIKILRLPTLDFARTYPTFGPQGIANLDINGLAASIELYLPYQVLIDDKGTLIPIQWTGFSQGLKQYQGEILNKSKIQTDFNKITLDILNGKSQVEQYNWNSMKIVFEKLFNIFND